MDRASATVTIARLNLRGARDDVARARTPLLAALDRAPWPDPGPDTLLFVRHLRLRGSATDIARRAADLVRELTPRAEDGWSRAADQADAVRFRSRADMSACLLADLLDGRAADRWFWARRAELFERPVPDAIVRILEEAPFELPELLDAGSARARPLAAIELLPRLMARLDAPATERLLGALRAATGWSLRFAAPEATAMAPAPGLPTALLATATRQAHALRLAPAAPAARLVAVLLAWRHVPAHLGTPDADVLLTRLTHLVTHDGARSAPQQPMPIARDATVPTPADTPSARPAPLPTAAPVEASTTGAHPGRTTTTSDPSREPASDAPAAECAATALHSPRAAAPEDGFVTSCGGLLFLLNVLALTPVQSLLGDRNLPGCGWRWLARLAATLGLEPDPPLAAFLATEAALASPDALAVLPPLAEEARLEAFAATRYGADLWRADAFRLPARIVATPSHVDAHFRLADARLGLRRAGLDLNPGWLPWLGRVVTFHFDDGPRALPSPMGKPEDFTMGRDHSPALSPAGPPDTGPAAPAAAKKPGERP